jgi:hypothetical protein
MEDSFVPPQRSETVEVFSLRPFKYRDVSGQKIIVQAWEDHSLPQRLHARASQKGVVTSIADERRRTHRGILNAELIRNPVDLDAELLPPGEPELPPGFERLSVGPERKFATAEPST